MKHLLLTTIAAVVLVGCGESQQSAPAPEVKPTEPIAEAAKPEPSAAKAPDISIHEAAFDGNIEIVRKHLLAGANVNEKDENEGGWTSLNFAVEAGEVETLKLLIKEGGDVNTIDESGILLLEQAMFLEQTEIIELLRKHGAKTITELKSIESNGESNNRNDSRAPQKLNTPKDTHVLRAASARNINKVKQAIADGHDINGSDANGITALWAAAFEGEKNIAEILLKSGANPNLPNAKGAAPTPLDMAIQQGWTDIADLLRKHGGKTGEELKAEGK